MPGSVLNARKTRRYNLDADNLRHRVFTLIFAALVAALDQLTKILAVNNLREGETVSVLGNFLQLKLIYNTGGALGTNLGGGIFYLVSSVLILGVVIYYIFSWQDSKLMIFSLGAIAGGAIGNIIDRIYLGKVVDFIDVDFFDFNFFGQRITRWWTFNIADAAITVGVVVILIYLIFIRPHENDGEKLEEPIDIAQNP